MLDACVAARVSSIVRALRMTFWHFIIFGVVAIHIGLGIWDASRMGFTNWFRASCRRSAFQALGERFHGPWRIIVPTLELALIMFCLVQIGLHKR